MVAKERRRFVNVRLLPMHLRREKINFDRSSEHELVRWTGHSPLGAAPVALYRALFQWDIGCHR
jgi:hypothetical protein